MKERTNAKQTELYATLIAFISAKEHVEKADIEADGDLTWHEDIKPVEKRAILRELVDDVNKAVDIARAGHNAEAREKVVEIVHEYGVYFYDTAVKSERQKRRDDAELNPRELADRIITKP